MPQYGDKLYWNGRYFDEINFHDWYCSYDDIQDPLENVINRLHRIFRKQTLEIMDLGCGTSQVSQRIVQKYGDKVNILAIDQSKNCIKFMDYIWKNDKNKDKNQEEEEEKKLNDDDENKTNDNKNNLLYSAQVYETMGYKKKDIKL